MKQFIKTTLIGFLNENSTKFNYLKSILSNEVEYKKLYNLEKEVRLLDKKFGVGATLMLLFFIDDSKKELEVELINNHNLWDREFREMKKYNISSYLKQFKTTDINYSDYKEELFDDLNNLLDKYSVIGGYKLRGSIAERSTGESDIPLFLINASDYDYNRKIAKEYSNNRL